MVTLLDPSDPRLCVHPWGRHVTLDQEQSLRDEVGCAWHRSCLYDGETAHSLLHERKDPMPGFLVAIDQITYDAVRAEDGVTAIDLALEGQGLEMHSGTRDAYISDYQSIELHRNA